jgi:integrase
LRGCGWSDLDELVVGDEFDGRFERVADRQAIRLGFREVCRAAGVSVIRLHDVRHSVATLLHSAGTAPAHAAALLGHGLPVHMATYVTATQDGVDLAGAALSRVLAEAK